MDDASLQTCAYCHITDDLRRSPFFTHPVCLFCLRVWREESRYDLTAEELGRLSREKREKEVLRG